MFTLTHVNAKALITGLMISCVRRVSGITFMRYAASQKIEKPSNLSTNVSENK